jgi:lysophospholipase L1-like esterase
MKRLLLTSALVAAAFCYSYAQQPVTVSDSSKFPAYYWHSKDMFDHLPDTRNEIVFLGNSITDGAEWFELLQNKKCRNRGISGDVTEGILLRLDGVTRLKPSAIFLLIGINDLSRNISVDEITGRYREILQRIEKETPGTKVYVQSVMPVNPATGRNTRLEGKTDLIIELNGRLQALAKEFGMTYIDLFTPLADDNNLLPRRYSIDGLHLSYEGYSVWSGILRQYIK